MAIHAQLNANQVGFGGSEFALINNNGFIGIRNDQSYVNNNLQSQKDLNQQALFHHQQNRSQRFLPVQMENQKQEIVELIKLQSERLRYVMQVQMKQEMEMISRNMEGKAMFLMNQKNEEMSKAMSKNMELSDLVRKLEMENQTLQRIARENETMVQRLNSDLEQARQRAATRNDACATAVEDEGSFCGGNGDGVLATNSCCNCGSNGVTRVLFLPCRHLCCCTDCEVGLVLCPICNSPKKHRIEAFIS